MCVCTPYVTDAPAVKVVQDQGLMTSYAGSCLTAGTMGTGIGVFAVSQVAADPARIMPLVAAVRGGGLACCAAALLALWCAGRTLSSSSSS